MPTDPVTDNRDQITHNAVGELAEGLLDKQGNLTFEIKRTSPVARDQYGNPLPARPQFGDLLTPALGDLRVKDWHKLPPMGDRTPARYLAEMAHLPEVVKATEKAQKVDTRWQAIEGEYRKAIADRDEWIRTTRTEIQVDANKGGSKHGITKATAERLMELDATVAAYERILGPAASIGPRPGALKAMPMNVLDNLVADSVADLSVSDASRLLVACRWVNAHNAARKAMSMPPGDWPASTMDVTGMLHGKGTKYAICWAREHGRDEVLQLQELDRQAGPWQQTLTEGLVRSWMQKAVDAAAA